MHAILAQYGLPYSYPAEVEKAAELIPDKIDKKEIARREDFRNVFTLTIDPADAKDFDDALSLRKLSPTLWEVGVHIADVTHYVKPGDLIDREAEKRATSIYLVDRTIPMLPERLSNVLCSLRPKEDKLCFSVIFELDENAEIKKSRITRTVIHSDVRLTYEEAQAVIETGKGDFSSEILVLNDLAQKMRERRFANGAINFERYEVKFNSMKKVNRWCLFQGVERANHLIEEFMLLANKTVAIDGKVPKTRMQKHSSTASTIFPIRELDTLNTFILRFGHKIKTEGSKVEVARRVSIRCWTGAGTSGEPDRDGCHPHHVESGLLYQERGALRSGFRLLYPFHLPDPKVPRHDGAPAAGALSQWRQLCRPVRVGDGVQALVRHGAGGCQCRTRFHQV